jgi:hypothetical protein
MSLWGEHGPGLDAWVDGTECTPPVASALVLHFGARWYCIAPAPLGCACLRDDVFPQVTR